VIAETVTSEQLTKTNSKPEYGVAEIMSELGNCKERSIYRKNVNEDKMS